MSIQANTVVTPEMLIDRFQAAVVNNILQGVYHSGNPPMLRGIQSVPSSIMDHLHNVNRTPSIGDTTNPINANSLLRGLIDITRYLTRVGTFTFTIMIEVSDTRTGNTGSVQVHDANSGKAIFNTGYIRHGFTNPSDIQNTVFGGTISASNLNQLFANIFQHWASSDRYHHVGTTTICHLSCHSNCHNNCHTNCHATCHMWGNPAGQTHCHSNCHSNCHTDCHLCHA